MKFDVRGLLVGLVLGGLGVPIIGFSYSIFKSLIFGSFTGERGYFELLTLLPAVAIIYIWSGFIVAKVCKKEKLFNSMVLACVTFLYLVIYPMALPIWYLITTTAMVFPFYYLGATLHVSRVNSVRNEIDEQ